MSLLSGYEHIVRENEPLAPMARALVVLSIGLIVFTMTVCLVAEFHILRRGVKKNDSTKHGESNDKSGS